MSNTVIRITPFGGFDIPGLEHWLSSMAGRGLRFSMTTGPLTWFEKTSPETVQFHLEPIQGKVEEDPELNALYEEAGWHYLGMFRGNFFVFASPDLSVSAHTDPATLDYSLRRFLRWKMAAGLILVLLNFLLLGLYQRGAPWEIDLHWLRCFPVETLSNGTTIPFLLSALGLFLIDLSYLLGLLELMRYRRTVKLGTPVKYRSGAGFLLAVGMLVLLPVCVNTIQLFSGLDYRPYDLEGSGFLTLTDIEGENVRLSGDPMYNMDHIAHSGTLLDPESWYFQQYGSFSQHGDTPGPNDVPRLMISITRYPLEILANLRAEEWSRQRSNGSGDYESLGAVHGLDEAQYAVRDGWTANNGQLHLPGGVLILRRGSTVLLADYYGEQDLSAHVEHLAQMLEHL